MHYVKVPLSINHDELQAVDFHTGRPLADILEYDESWYAHVPEAAVASFAGTGNPFSIAKLRPGMNVLDIGSGAGFDSLIAAKMVGPEGQVIGVDMTPAMLRQARQALAETELTNVTFKEGYGESLPVEDGWADVAISNGVINLCADKQKVFTEIFRVLKPGGVLVLSTPYDEKVQYSLCIHCNQPTPLHAHIHSFTEKKMQALLDRQDAVDHKVFAFSSKVLLKLKTHILLRFLPFSWWRAVDRLVNRLYWKPVRLLAAVQKETN